MGCGVDYLSSLGDRSPKNHSKCAQTIGMPRRYLLQENPSTHCHQMFVELWKGKVIKNDS